MLRAFEENWNMAHELRLTAQQNKAAKWLAGANDTYLASIPVLDRTSSATVVSMNHRLDVTMAHLARFPIQRGPRQ